MGIDKEDKLWFAKMVGEKLKEKFRMTDPDPEIWGKIMWCDFVGSSEKQYEEAKDPVKVQKVLEDSNYDYNITHSSPMNLVFFRDCVDHISRCSRVFRQPRGNLLLVGVGGS